MAGQGVSRLIADDVEQAQRESRQFRVLLSASLITTTDEIPVKIRELSCMGAMVEALRLPSTGADVILKRGALEIFATVAWWRGRRASLAFEDAVSEAELLTHIHQQPVDPQLAVETGKRRPGFGNARLSSEERELAAEWANPAGRRAYRD